MCSQLWHGLSCSPLDEMGTDEEMKPVYLAKWLQGEKLGFRKRSLLLFFYKKPKLVNSLIKSPNL